MSSIPVLKDQQARKKSIVKNTPAIFNISSNEGLSGGAPFYEVELASEVGRWCLLIEQVAKKHGVGSELAKAIMFMETTHGWYDRLYPFKKTILPMNIHYQYWRKLGVTKDLLKCPFYNIEFGVILLARIQARIKDPTPRKNCLHLQFSWRRKSN